MVFGPLYGALLIGGGARAGTNHLSCRHLDWRTAIADQNFVAVSAYDGMELIYRALEATKGSTTDGPALVEAMKRMQ